MVSMCDVVNTWFGCIFIIGVATGQPLIEKARFPPNYISESHLKATIDNQDQNQIEPRTISTKNTLLELYRKVPSSTVQTLVTHYPESLNNNELQRYSKSSSVANDIAINPSGISKFLTGIQPDSQIVSLTSFDPSLDALLTRKTNEIEPLTISTKNAMLGLDKNVPISTVQKTVTNYPDSQIVNITGFDPALDALLTRKSNTLNVEKSRNLKPLPSNSESYPKELLISKLSSPPSVSSNALPSISSSISDTFGSFNKTTFKRHSLPNMALKSVVPGSASTVVETKTSPQRQNPLIKSSSWPIDNTGDVFVIETGIIDSNFMSNFQPTNVIDSGSREFSSFRQINQARQRKQRPMARRLTMPFYQNWPSSFFSTMTGLRRRFPCILGPCYRPSSSLPVLPRFYPYTYMYRPFF